MATLVAAPALIPLEAYLASSYEPDCEFVDGELEEKTMGEWEHSFLQVAIGSWFFARRDEWQIDVLTEYRTRTSPTRVRLPDIAVVRQGEPVERVRVSPPLICIEILSPEDRLVRVMRRLDEFLAMGTEHLWVIDPQDRAAAVYSREGLKMVEGGRLTMPGSPIHLDLAAVFALLDRKPGA